MIYSSLTSAAMQFHTRSLFFIQKWLKQQETSNGGNPRSGSPAKSLIRGRELIKTLCSADLKENIAALTFDPLEPGAPASPCEPCHRHQNKAKSRDLRDTIKIIAEHLRHKHKSKKKIKQTVLMGSSRSFIKNSMHLYFSEEISRAAPEGATQSAALKQAAFNVT